MSNKYVFKVSLRVGLIDAIQCGYLDKVLSGVTLDKGILT